MNKHQKEIGRSLEALGFQFEGYDSKSATVYRHPSHPEAGPIRVHGTPNDGKGTYSTREGALRQARALIEGRKRANELFIDWLCKKYGIGEREAKQVRFSVAEQVRLYLREIGDGRTPATLQGWFSDHARDTGRIARLDLKTMALWEIRGPKWGISPDAGHVAPETKGAPVGVIRPGPPRGRKKAMQRKRDTGGAAPPPVVSPAPPAPEQHASTVERSAITSGQDRLLAAGWEQVGQQWRHPDLPQLGKVWFSKAVAEERIRAAWPDRKPEREAEPVARQDVRIEVPAAAPAAPPSDAADLFERVAKVMQEPVVKRAEDAEALAELRREALVEANQRIAEMQVALGVLLRQIGQAIAGA